MITNGSITYYHKGYSQNNHLETWTKYYFNDVWIFGGKGSSINKGYDNANNVDVRIPMEYIDDTSLFAIGDIIVKGEQDNITKQADLNGKEFYNVTSININNFGNNQHIHLGGK